MKRQDLVNYHQQTSQNLEAEIDKRERLLVEARQKKALGQLKNLHEVKALRQDIARLKTIIRNKQLNTVKEPEVAPPAPKKPAKKAAKKE